MDRGKPSSLWQTAWTRPIETRQILSYEPSNPEASMWVKVSDHSHELPARLSTTAIAEHNRSA
jgi:hypothetical protein